MVHEIRSGEAYPAGLLWVAEDSRCGGARAGVEA